MLCSSEDASVTQNTWCNSCAVTHKPPSPLPQPITDCGESLTVTLRSLCPRFCEQETVDDQFETCVLPRRKAEAYGYTWFTRKHACWIGALPPRALHPPTPHKHTNKGLHKLSCDVLLCIYFEVLHAVMSSDKGDRSNSILFMVFWCIFASWLIIFKGCVRAVFARCNNMKLHLLLPPQILLLCCCSSTSRNLCNLNSYLEFMAHFTNMPLNSLKELI